MSGESPETREGRERPLRWDFLGRVEYSDGVALQEALREGVLAGTAPDHLVLLEHSAVYTLGRSASRDDVLYDRPRLDELGVDLAETDRGGQVTFHGPGQLVGYPILDLNPDRRDVRRYVRDLEATLIAVLAHFGISASAGRDQATIGVWVEKRKIASIGVHLSRWVTTHGFALNVATDLALFQGIVPCGLEGVDMTSIAAETGSAPPLEEVALVCAREFARVFSRSLERVEVSSPVLGAGVVR